MDSVEHRPAELLNRFEAIEPQVVLKMKPRSKSPELQKQALIEKIRYYQSKNDEIEAKHQSMQNIVCDLRKLLHSSSVESEDYIKQIEEENCKLNERALRLQAGLKYAHQNGKHFENCSLFWRQFVQ